MHTLLVWAYKGNARNPHPNVTIRVHIIEIVVKTVQQFLSYSEMPIILHFKQESKGVQNVVGRNGKPIEEIICTRKSCTTFVVNRS